MDFLVSFYIFLFYLTLSFILYRIVCIFKLNNSHPILGYIGLGENFILSSWMMILFYFCFRIYIDNEMLCTSKMNYSKFKKTAKTGDLIIYRWEYVDVGYRMFSKFSHVAMVVKKGKNIYLLETHPNENKTNNKPDNQGIHLYLLKNRLSQYNGQYYLARLNKNIDRTLLTNNIIKDLSTYKKKIPFDNSFRDLFVYNYFANRLGIKLPKQKEMFCSQFIGHLLDKNKIYKHKENLASIEPGSFLSFEENGKKIYSDLTEICFKN